MQLVKSHNHANNDYLIFSANLNPDGSGGPYDFYSYKAGAPFEVRISKFSGDQTIGGLEDNILSGTFNICLTNPLNDTLKITNGRSDIRKG